MEERLLTTAGELLLEKVAFQTVKFVGADFTYAYMYLKNIFKDTMCWIRTV